MITLIPSSGVGGETTNEEVPCLLKSLLLGAQFSTTSSEMYKAKHTHLRGRISLEAAGAENKMREPGAGQGEGGWGRGGGEARLPG